MKISVNSWHYRYMRKLGFSAPRNLCPYFWKLMFSLMVPVFFLVFAVVTVAILIVAIIAIIHHPGPFLIVLAVVGGAIAVIFTIGWLIFSSTSRRAFSSLGDAPVIGGVADGLSLTRDYIKATHHKLCPVLDFVDENDPHRKIRIGPDESYVI